MKSRLLASALALATLAPALAAPASAQNYSAQQRWDAAQQRYQAETDLYNRERDRYYASRDRNRGGGGPGYGYASPPPQAGYGNQDDRYATTYDASRYYRDDPRYQERVLTSNDEVYRGSDGRYYCKRSDGTSGLIVGAAAGGILGNVIDGGHNRVAGTLVGGALGALLGKSVDQQNSQIRCR